MAPSFFTKPLKKACSKTYTLYKLNLGAQDARHHLDQLSLILGGVIKNYYNIGHLGLKVLIP